MKSHTLAITGILIVFVLGIIALNAVQAQSTPTQPVTSTSGSSDYKRLISNLPVVDEMVKDSVPVFSKGENIRPALEYLAKNKQKGFAAIKNPLSGNGLYVLISEPSSGNEGEIQVYRYYGDEKEFALMDCSLSWLADSETDNIAEDGEILDEKGDPITIDEFLEYYDCGLGWIDQTITPDDLSYTENDDESFGIGGSIKEILQASAKSITESYAGKTPAPFVIRETFVEESLPAATNTTAATATTSSSQAVTACQFGEKIYEYQLDASGRVNIVSGNPTMISSNPFNLVSNDNRLTQPATILFKDSKGTEKYIVNITDYSLEDDRITVAMQLCTYENGWKSYWDKVSYSVWTEKGKRESPVGARNAKVGTALLADFINYKNNAEIRADFMSTNKSTISVYLYIAEDEKSIHSIAFDSAKESANTIFRFNLNAASIQTIQDALTPEELTPDQVREKLTVQIKGTKNAKGADTTFSLITAEGPLNREGNANPTFDAKYWKVGKTPITPGEYKFLFTIPGYRPIERTVLINAKDLSTSDPNKLIQADVFDSFNIRPEDLKEDRCTNATTLELGLLCVDTAFVDAIISSK